MKAYMDLVYKFIGAHQLGSYHPEKWSISLYDVKNDKETIDEIKRKIELHTKSYKLIKVDPNLDYTNIIIIDIGL